MLVRYKTVPIFINNMSRMIKSNMFPKCIQPSKFSGDKVGIEIQRLSGRCRARYLVKVVPIWSLKIFKSFKIKDFGLQGLQGSCSMYYVVFMWFMRHSVSSTNSVCSNVVFKMSSQSNKAVLVQIRSSCYLHHLNFQPVPKREVDGWCLYLSTSRASKKSQTARTI